MARHIFLVKIREIGPSAKETKIMKPAIVASLRYEDDSSLIAVSMYCALYSFHYQFLMNFVPKMSKGDFSLYFRAYKPDCFAVSRFDSVK